MAPSLAAEAAAAGMLRARGRERDSRAPRRVRLGLRGERGLFLEGERCSVIAAAGAMRWVDGRRTDQRQGLKMSPKDMTRFTRRTEKRLPPLMRGAGEFSRSSRCFGSCE